MRVALLVEQLLAAVPGGGGRYSRELAAALVRTGRPDDEVTSWVGWHRDVAPARVAGVLGPRRLALPRRALAEAWRRGVGPAPRGADVVHVPTLQVPPRREAPLVVSIHDAVPWTHPELLTSRGAAWHRDMAERAIAQASAIGVLTAAVAAELSDVLPGIAGLPVRILGAGVTHFDDPGPAADRLLLAHFGLPARFALFVGTVEPRKGLDVLVEALAAMGTDRVRLVVAGPPGWGDVDPAELARRNRLPADAVLPLGRVSDAELGALLRSALALAAPSRSEGFGLPVAEALAAGTPVVCSDIPALAEVSSGAALLVPVDDAEALAAALTRIAGDEQLRASLVAAGRARAPELSWDAVGRRAWSLYRELLA